MKNSVNLVHMAELSQPQRPGNNVGAAQAVLANNPPQDQAQVVGQVIPDIPIGDQQRQQVAVLPVQNPNVDVGLAEDVDIEVRYYVM